ncbi:MAG: hypothetical protein K6F20_13190 [Bacteroidaceae bacterium]|nr:hypothetical protein [Bacteroidaceae bacterium]
MKKIYIQPTTCVTEIRLSNALLTTSTISFSDQPGTFDVKEDRFINHHSLWDDDWSTDQKKGR